MAATAPTSTVTDILSAELSDGRIARLAGGDAPVPWWSFSKTVLAAAALALVRDGALALDTPLDARPFTLRHLLQHTAGVPNYGGLASYHAAVARGDPPWTEAELLRQVPPERLLFSPGSGWSYSNIGYLLVRHEIEAGAGATLDSALRRLIFSPLGIDEVGVAEQPAELPGRMRGYHPGWVFHGLLVGSPRAAALLLDRLLTGDLLPPELRSAMLAAWRIGGPFPGRPFRAPAYGLGVMVDAEGSLGRAIGHTGQGPGSTVAVYHFPDLVPRRTVAAFAPIDGDAAQGEIESRVLSLASAPGGAWQAPPPASPG